MINKRLIKLKKLLDLKNLDGYIIPKNDEFFSEYSKQNRLKIISNFSGSAGFAIILKDKNYLFVDGRYTVQSKIECGKYFKIFEIPKIFPYHILNKKLKIGFDPHLFTSSTLVRYFNNSCDLIPENKNLVDLICVKKKSNKNSFFYNLNEYITGENISSKINRLSKILGRKKIDNIFISAPENVAWLLNLRGKDNPNSPIPNCKLLLSKKKEIFLFSNKSKIKNIKNNPKYKNLKFYDYDLFFSTINLLGGKNFSIDNLSCSVHYESLIRSKFKIINLIDPCYELKAIKNKTELKNMKMTHIYDGAALTKFLYWIKKKNLKGLNELNVEKKLESFRKKNKNYLYPSFNTIAGSGPNGAIIHYRANKSSNRRLKKNELLLCDSGGQYKYGTTDVTRTVSFNKPSLFIKNIFTRVLKGHIAVATTNLNKINKGYEIDKRARKWLKKINLDYGHGTGHGVGFFLNVHEGPHSISKYSRIPLKKGMIVSNEPGYYKENKFGIRIENLIYISKEKNKLLFKNLTMAPVDKDLINFNLLDKKEKDYLFKYNLEIYSNISKYLNRNEKKWLQDLI